MLQKIEDNWPILPSGVWNSSSIQLLSRHLLEFDKRCEQLGEEKLHRLVSAIDEAVSRVINDNTPPDSHQMESLNRYLEELRSMIGETRYVATVTAPAAVSPSMASPFDVVWLPAPDDEPQALIEALESKSLRYRILSDPQDLQALLANPGTKTLLLDAGFLGLQPLEPVLHLLKNEQIPMPALVIISDQGNIEMRLRALRAGAVHLYSKPINLELMLDSLQPYINPRPEPRRRILIVEDDVTQASFASKLLQKEGMDTLTIADPLGVIEAVARYEPDLILMDLYMPGADGIELTRLIRDRWESSSIPVVFLSGEDDQDKQLLTLYAGADDFLSKPVRPKQLLATVNTRIDRNRHIAAKARRQALKAPLLPGRGELLSLLDLALTGGEGPPSYRALLVICLCATPSSPKQENEDKPVELVSSIVDTLQPMLQPEDTLAALDERRLALLYFRHDEVSVERLAEQIYEALSSKSADIDGAGIGIGMTLLDSAERSAYEQLCRAEASAESAFGRGLQGYELHGEEPPAPREAVDEITAMRESILESIAKDSVAFRKLSFIGQAADTEETYELIPLPFNVEIDEDPFQTVAGCGLAGKFDRLVFQQALQELCDMIMQGRMGRVIFRQSASVLEDPEYLDFIKTELRRHQIVGTGLIVDFDLPSLAADLIRARTLIEELTELGLRVVLGSFACNETSYKVLTYLMADAVRPHHSLLGIDKDRIGHIVNQLKSLHAEIIMPRVLRPDQIASPWSELADYVQVEFDD